MWAPLQKDPEPLQKYRETFLEQERNGVIEQTSTDRQQMEYFIPHQPVLRSYKNTTKLRIVFDASAKLRGRASLNEQLFREPVILPDLLGILLRWRTRIVSVTADLEKAFLQLGFEQKIET
ncbi:unnamed protein product [Toxocara canis]|uniref:DUF1758 domain-containing protein n=1 Tax=Toxocara canis TaxID=6265 RepID=A0A183VEX7_TOXCA|nr:unnamed protein product [Toxocara canis]